MSQFSKNLKDIIKKRKLTITEISKGTNIPISNISEWAQGRKPVLSEDLIRLADYLEVSLEYLITGKNKEDEIIENIINRVGEEFTQIHKGIYRITVEKQKVK